MTSGNGTQPIYISLKYTLQEADYPKWVVLSSHFAFRIPGPLRHFCRAVTDLHCMDLRLSSHIRRLDIFFSDSFNCRMKSWGSLDHCHWSAGTRPKNKDSKFA